MFKKKTYALLFSVLIPGMIIAMYAACGSYKESRRDAGGRSYRSSGKQYPSRMEKSIEGAAGLKDGYFKSEYPAESEKKPPSTTASKKRPAGRMVIYEAYLLLDVESVKKTLDAVNAMVVRVDGYVQSAETADSYRQATVILRVPVKIFDTVMKEIEKMGSVRSKSVSAQDVTMEYSDLSLRVETARKVRERFYALLKRTKKVEERVKILREIERLTQMIESLTTHLQSLGDRASYSTIKMELRAKVTDTVRVFLPSPFPWIAGLSPDRRTVFTTPSNFLFEVPKGFFNLDDEFTRKQGTFLFSSPDGNAGIRMGTVENYPPAGTAFWDEAFVIEMKNRMYKNLKSDEITTGRGLVLKHYLYQTSIGIQYEISFYTGNDEILIVEAVYRTEDAFKNHHPAAIKFLKSLRAGK